MIHHNFMFRMVFIGVFINSLYFTAQGFDEEAYSRFIEENAGITAGELITRAQPASPYYSSIIKATSGVRCDFLDSIGEKYSLTSAELSLLAKNGFMATERVGYTSFGRALHDMYAKDLPVFLTTDAVLYAMHKSYDDILMVVEQNVLLPEIKSILSSLYNGIPALVASYVEGTPLLDSALRDVDLYVTMALSLAENVKKAPHFVSTGLIDTVWNAVAGEQMSFMPLFSKTERKLDFSQFTVRGHYTRTPSLRNYFRAMMWLGRIDFLLTVSSHEMWDPSDPRRMSMGACLLNELIDRVSVRQGIAEIDRMLALFVGESDDLTPAELLDITDRSHVADASALLADTTYALFQKNIAEDPRSEQKILSDFITMNGADSVPDTLPVSFKILGQRFIIDSYVFSNVVYDRIVHNGRKIYRMMPDPLDAMYALGNDDALPLLKNELEIYPYGAQLNNLRYLIDAYKPDFWQQSLYNTWLQAIRLLKPDDDRPGLPLFMKTTAWHQEKLNTQLAAWSELRHDNLLYAKQSYTGGSECSFPHSYIEPYPEFYRQIGVFADNAAACFTDAYQSGIRTYFANLKSVMCRLDTLAQKELSGTAFSDSEKVFLQKMLFIETGSGAPPFSGWYADMFFNNEVVADSDYIIADVHTQPTDEGGGVVGNVLHVATGKINLGVFIAPSPSNNFAPMAYVGPVFSYYEKITGNFLRLTDENWTASVLKDSLPRRPDWVNSFLADNAGAALPPGRTLDGVEYSVGTIAGPKTMNVAHPFLSINNHSRPMTAVFTIPEVSDVKLSVYNQRGQLVCRRTAEHRNAGAHSMRLNTGAMTPGLYLVELVTDKGRVAKRVVAP
ncbi:MAG: DUF3160 domain-containing protein [Chitinispirillaceae bacterium]|nr:DUF3160 domain-containing protein [Chitinispirillaceae bacterium]